MWDNVLHFVFDFSLWVSDFFVLQPGHFWAVSAVFGILFLAALIAKNRFPQIWCWPLLIALLMWLFFGLSERDNVIRNVDIRIDVVFVWPFLFAGTALLIGLFILSLIRAIIAGNASGPTKLNRQRVPRSACPSVLFALLGRSAVAPTISTEDNSSTSTQPDAATPCAVRQSPSQSLDNKT